MYRGRKSKWSKKTKFLKEFVYKEYGQGAKDQKLSNPFDCCRYFLLFLSHNILIDDDWFFSHFGYLISLHTFWQRGLQAFVQNWSKFVYSCKVSIRKWIKIKKVPHCTYTKCYHIITTINIWVGMSTVIKIIKWYNEREGNDPRRLL